MNARTHVLRPPAHHRGSADPFTAILPEVAEPKLDITLADEDDNLIPLRQAVREGSNQPFWKKLLRAKAKR